MATLAAPTPDANTIAITGAGFTRVLRLGALGAPSGGTVSVVSHGGAVDRYAGPSLWDVLQRAGVLPDDPRARAREVLLVSGRDGYVAAVALGELDPAFEDKVVLLATTRNGAALASPRLVIAGDRHPGRDVRDVDQITVR